MKEIKILIGFILACVLLINCGEPEENVFGSLDHDIETAKATEPAILANGISTTQIVVTVRDNDGYIASGMKVVFHTTYGSIDEFDYTGYSVYRNAIAELTSVASETDLLAKVTATVVDTAFHTLNKKAKGPFTVTMHIPGHNNEGQRINHLKKSNQPQDNTATIYVKFLGVTIDAAIEDSTLPADGISETKLTIRLQETTSQKAIMYEDVRIGIKYGIIESDTKTNIQGISEVSLRAPEQAAADTVCVEYGNKLSKCLHINYLTPKFSLTSNTVQVPAGGESKIQIIATLVTQKNTPIIGAEVKFSTSAGIIKESAITNEYGQAIVGLIAGMEPDSQVVVVAKFLALIDSVTVAFFSTLDNYPNSILLDAEPNYIWVKETGNLEQATISATILGITGQPVGNDIGVNFRVINGPGGGEVIEPSSGSPLESSLIKTVNGKAEAFIRAGIRSGTLQIRAELVDYPDVEAQTTNIVIRSGPPYMWIDETNVNNVISHTTLTVPYGKCNVAFANPVQDIDIGAIFGDKYNNPVEKGTTVYFTTTGGIITSDAITCDKGQSSVILQDCYPFPYLRTDDSNQLTTCCIPNPNDENVWLDLNIPDFEGSLITNSMGTKSANDGCAVILAYTWGQDQNGNNVKVWGTTMVVYSSAIHTFTAYADKTVLELGEYTTIEIRLYDIHGNPVAAGSRLTASATSGELSEKDLMPSTENYGYGTTFFQTQLLNNLDPLEDEETNAIVTIDLDSPNGSTKRIVSVYLKI